MLPVAGSVWLAVEEGGEGHNPLIPNANELFWGTICFAIFAFFMMKYVLPKARVALEQRTAGIEGKLEQAERDRAEAQALLAQYREQLADARSEAGRIRNEAQTQRAQIVEEARVEARTEAQRILEAAAAQIATERQQALNELRRDVGSLAVTLAGKVVGESLEDDARQRRTVDRFLDSLDGAATAPAGSAAP
jgi:F-type H+-transporting ATPase subunit b